MAANDAHGLLLYHNLIAPLVPNPDGDLEIAVNDLRVQYRTYCFEYNVEHGVVMLPLMFDHDFGDHIGRYTTLVDPNGNEFEVLVERSMGGIVLTKGWGALHDLYDISLGAWVTAVFVGEGKFGINIKDRFRKLIRYPKFVPSMKFKIDRNNLPHNIFGVMPAPFAHDELNFQFTYEKTFTADEIEFGFMNLHYPGFCQLTHDKKTTSVRLVDECGNLWNCTLTYARRPYAHFKVGGAFKRMVQARGISNGVHVLVGAPKIGSNETLYFRLVR